MFKSMKEAFAAAARKLDKLGYTVAGSTSPYKPTHKENGYVRTMTQMPIADTDGIVLVIYEKVAGMKGDYQLLVVNGPKAIDMKLYAMTQPRDESYHELLK